MEEIREKCFIDGGEIKPVSEFYEFLNEPGTFIFEVLRVISGTPLFVDEHLMRLKNSLLVSGISTIVDITEIRNCIYELIKENKTEEGNIKIVLRCFQHRIFFWLYFIPFRYPSLNDYKKGVKVGSFKTERINPIAKTIQPGVRETANNIIKKYNLYEVLLVDKKGFIREGSRSNVFFVKEDLIITPPVKMILNGITRQKAISIINSQRFNFREDLVSVNEIDSFDCIFLTGTSPKILPVSNIDNHYFNSDCEICRKIIYLYDEMIKNYISEFK